MKTEQQNHALMKFMLLERAGRRTPAQIANDAYSFAWASGVWPALHPSNEWHHAFESEFKVSKAFVELVIKYVSIQWDKYLSREAFPCYRYDKSLWGENGATKTPQQIQISLVMRYLFLSPTSFGQLAFRKKFLGDDFFALTAPLAKEDLDLA